MFTIRLCSKPRLHLKAHTLSRYFSSTYLKKKKLLLVTQYVLFSMNMSISTLLALSCHLIRKLHHLPIIYKSSPMSFWDSKESLVCTFIFLPEVIGHPGSFLLFYEAVNLYVFFFFLSFLGLLWLFEHI